MEDTQERRLERMPSIGPSHATACNAIHYVNTYIILLLRIVARYGYMLASTLWYHHHGYRNKRDDYAMRQSIDVSGLQYVKPELLNGCNY